MQSQPLALQDLAESLAAVIRTAQRQAAAGLGLQPVHLQALQYLARANRYSNTPQALADYLGMTKGTVSQSVLLLARKRLVSRYADEKDARVVRLALTEQGRELLRQATPSNPWREVLQGVSPARLASALRVLREVVAGLEQHAGRKGYGWCHSCRHCMHIAPRTYVCGLTREKLGSREVRMICRLHEPPEEKAPVA